MSKQGNPRLRYMLTEAVHVHVMYCADSRLDSLLPPEEGRERIQESYRGHGQEDAGGHVPHDHPKEGISSSLTRPLSFACVEERSLLIAAGR